MTTTTLLAIVLGIAFVTGGGFALRDVLAARSRRARAVPANGVVVAVDGDDSSPQVVVVRYRDAAGAEHDATSAGMPPLRQLPGGRLARGQQVRLCYDPKRPSWVLLEGSDDPVAVDLVVGVVGVLAGALLLAGVLVLGGDVPLNLVV